MAKWLLVSLIAIAGAACSNKLETDYEPEDLGKIGANQRRALYSDPYSQEAQDARQDRANEAKERRPTP